MKEKERVWIMEKNKNGSLSPLPPFYFFLNLSDEAEEPGRNRGGGGNRSSKDFPPPRFQFNYVGIGEKNLFLCGRSNVMYSSGSVCSRAGRSLTETGEIQAASMNTHRIIVRARCSLPRLSLPSEQ